jgi:hypothetical protein
MRIIMKSLNQTDVAYAAAGNAINLFVLVASLVYAALVVYFSQPENDNVGVLDEQWKEDGFCIQNKHVAYQSSFDWCLYVDVVFSLMLLVMWLNWRKLPGMERASEVVPMVILSTVGHGLAHGGMAAKLRDGQHEAEDASGMPEVPPFSHLVAFCGIFWFPLLKAAMPKIHTALVALFAVIVTFGPILVGGIKKQLGFAYVQTIISIAFHFSQLSLPSDEKQCREYMTMPMSGIIPILVAWNEALLCTAYFQSFGGHLIYDASIILSFIAFYIDSYRACTANYFMSSVIGKEKTT